MSRIYQMFSKDLPRNFWLFRIPGFRGEGLTLRPEYEKYRCRSCGKINEIAALSEPLPEGLKVPLQWDVVGSEDNFVFVGARFREVYESEGMRGLDFKELPSDSRYWLAMPTCLVDTDEEKAGFVYAGPVCSVCGRPREAAVGPLVASMDIPSDPKMIFTSKKWSESAIGRRILLFFHEPVLKALKKARLKGAEYLEAF